MVTNQADAVVIPRKQLYTAKITLIKNEMLAEIIVRYV